jgi:hypothetical protein
MNVLRTLLLSSFVIFSLFQLSGCGGGGKSDGGGAPAGVITPFVPSASTLAGKQVAYSTPFYDSIGSGSGCYNVKNTAVYVLPNTETYAADGVGELSQQQVAEYAEQSIASIRNTFGLTATVGFQNVKIQICVQPNTVVGGAVGSGAPKGFTGVSTDSANIDRAYLISNYDLYKKLVTHELVHTYQTGTLAGSFGVVETWFSEGLAEYVASGLSSQSKSAILSLVASKNPVSVWQNSFSSTNLQYYPSFQSSVGYLYSPNGAKNSLFQVPSLFASIKTLTPTALSTCGATSSCATVIPDVFAQAFVSTLKEADGTPMLLRSGANNLQDTVSTRLNTFLP